MDQKIFYKKKTKLNITYFVCVPIFFLIVFYFSSFFFVLLVRALFRHLQFVGFYKRYSFSFFISSNCQNTPYCDKSVAILIFSYVKCQISYIRCVCCNYQSLRLYLQIERNHIFCGIFFFSSRSLYLFHPSKE